MTEHFFRIEGRIYCNDSAEASKVTSELVSKLSGRVGVYVDYSESRLMVQR